MSKKKSSRDSPLMIDSAQQTDLRITSNGNLVKSNQKLYTFYDYRDKMKKNAETSTAFHKPKVKKKVKFEYEDSSENEFGEKYNKYKNSKLNRKKSESMKDGFRYYREDSDENSSHDTDQYHVQREKKVIYLRESPEQKEETKIVYVRNARPDVPLVPNLSEKYIYQSNIAPIIVPTQNIVAKTPSLVQIAPIKPSIQTFPFRSPFKHNPIIRSNSVFK